MDIQQLKYFLYIAQCKNFTRTAEHFYIGQPALSRSISALEKELGVTLFERNNRQVTLTEAGKILSNGGVSILEQIEHAVNNARNVDGEADSVLSIGCLEKLDELVSRLGQNYQSLYPNTKLQIECALPHVLYESVASGIFDIGITLDYQIGDHFPLEKTILSSEPFCILAPSDSKFAKYSEVCSNDLFGEQIYLMDSYEPAFFKRLFLDFANFGTKPNVKLVSTIESLCLHVGAGLGIAIVPRFVANSIPDSAEISAYLLNEPEAKENIVLIYRRGNKDSAIDKLLFAAHKSLFNFNNYST